MAICMMCHRKVPHGVRFCDECEIKRKQQADESYLDSLLNSVSKKASAPAEASASQTAAMSYNMQNSEENAFGQAAIEDSPFDYSGDTSIDNSSGAYFGDTSTDNTLGAHYEDTSTDNTLGAYYEDTSTDNTLGAYYEEASDNSSFTDSFEDNPEDMDAMLNDLLADMEESGFGDGTDELPDTEIDPNDLADIFNEAESNIYESNSIDSTYADSVNTSNESLFNVEDESESGTYEDTQTYSDASMGEASDYSDNISSSDDKLFNDEFDTTGLGPADIAILNGDMNSAVNAEFENNGLPEGVVVDSDMDALFQEIDENESIQDINDTEDLNSILGLDANDSELEDVLNNMSKGSYGEDENLTSSDSLGKKKNKNKKSDNDDDKPKKSFWKRLFGNILDKTPEQVEAEEKQAEIDAQKRKEKAEEDKLKAEEEKARLKAEAEIAKKEKEARKAAEKAAAAEKAKKKKEAALALAEFEVEHGRINKAGATILFVIFAVLTIIIIIGTNIYSYNLSIENAQKDFDIHKYNEAYYEVYGLKIQDEDIELYDRIMTVMYINTQLNSYEYYMTSNNREKALDSLLKGLERYDKYLQLATILDIKEDIDYVKNNIVEKLRDEFNLSLDQAYSMITIDDKIDYSDSIYSLLGSYEEQLNMSPEKEAN